MHPILRRGGEGEMVAELQRRLRGLGFSPGAIDGRFGGATEAALLAFQRSRRLLADGVCGPRSWAAIEPDAEADWVDQTRALDAELVSRLFPSTPLGAIRAHLPAVVAGLREFGVTEKPLVLVALATIRAESEGFTPAEEALSRFNTSPGGAPFDLYDHRADLENRGAPDGAHFRGRGFAQLTGRYNYRRFGARLGLGDALLHRPEMAAEPGTAGRALGAFLAAKRTALKEALLEGDARQARRLVNGGTNGLDRFTDVLRRGDAILDDPVWRPGPLATAT